MDPKNPPPLPTQCNPRIRELTAHRIMELEEELKKHGLRARCGMEIEFFVDSEPNKPVTIPKQRLEAITSELKKSRYVEDLREENVQRHWTQTLAVGSVAPIAGTISSILTKDPTDMLFGAGLGVISAALFSSGLITNLASGRATKAAQYEINLGDTLAGTPAKEDAVGNTPTRRHNLGPLKAAIATEHIQSRITELLQPEGTVNFTAKPRKDNLTSAIHVNVSLSNKDGQNLFIGKGNGESPLMTACVANLVEIQEAGSLLFLPNENSHERIHNGNSAPKRIGRNAHKSGGLTPSSTTSARSASLLGKAAGILHGNIPTPETNHIENRMAGADADPYLAVLATLAALVKTVREQEQGIKTPKAQKHKLHGNLQDSIREFNKSELMKELLGTELHSAITEHYAQGQQR